MTTLLKAFSSFLAESLGKIPRGTTIQKKHISDVEDAMTNSHLDKKVLAKISFDNDAIYLTKSGKTIATSKTYVGKMDTDDLIKFLTKTVK